MSKARTYGIDGMHCGSCVGKVTEAVRAVDGADDVAVTLDPPRLVVTTRDDVPREAIAAAVEGAGDYRLGADVPTAPSTPAASGASASAETDNERLYPLFLIVAFLLGTVLIVHFTTPGTTWPDTMRHFMAGFFLVFSFFKLLDLPGFVSAYRGYDLLAARSVAWARLYPFVELALGVAYLIDRAMVVVNAITLALMLIGAAGVLRALVDRKAIRCACLGTALNLPMTKVTLIEDLTMAAMAAVMLIA